VLLGAFGVIEEIKSPCGGRVFRDGALLGKHVYSVLLTTSG